MRVLFIPISILLSYNAYLVNGLSALGVRIYLDAPRPPFARLIYIREKLRHRIGGELLPTFILPDCLREMHLKGLANKHHIDILHLNDPKIPIDTLKRYKQEGIKILFVTHSAPLPTTSYTTLNDLLDVYVVPSYFTLNMERKKLDLKKTIVIHHGINVYEFRPYPRELAFMKIGLKTNKKIVLWNDRIAPEKDLKTFLEAIPLVLRDVRDVLFYIKGRAVVKEYYEKIKHLLKNPKISDHIRLQIGWISHEKLPFLYSTASVFVRTSLLESFGLGYIEAMACGVPTIASDIAIAREVIGDAGLFYVRHDPLDLADKIVKVVLDNEMQGLLGKKARKRVLKHFRHDIMARKYYEVYVRLINEDPILEGKEPT